MTYNNYITCFYNNYVTRYVIRNSYFPLNYLAQENFYDNLKFQTCLLVLTVNFYAIFNGTV